LRRARGVGDAGDKALNGEVELVAVIVDQLRSADDLRVRLLLRDAVGSAAFARVELPLCVWMDGLLQAVAACWTLSRSSFDVLMRGGYGSGDILRPVGHDRSCLLAPLGLVPRQLER
jgi:hypothetical protein